MFYEYLRDIVSVLASPAEAQRLWLSNLGTYPSADELALEFEDFAVHVPQLVIAGFIDERASESLAGISTAFAAVPAEPEAWDAERSRESPEWIAVRQAAGRAVVELVKRPVTVG